MHSAWSLDPNIAFLNHGSFGACPIPVLEYQSELRAELEREPVAFFNRRYESLLDESREALARFVGARIRDLVFVPNATTAVNAVIRSLDLEPGDELVTTNHAYNACTNVLKFAADRAGAKVVIAQIPFPLKKPRLARQAVMSVVTDRTKLVMIDHVSSPTGMIFPIEALTQQLENDGIRVLIDGAHGPGMLDLNIAEIGASYYTGTCHKWMCAPKGAAFLHVREDRHKEVRPAVISHGANSPRKGRTPMQVEFDWTGTTDPTAWLCVGTAIREVGKLNPGGWAAIRARNRSAVLDGRDLLCEALDVRPPCPEEMIGSIATVQLPDDPGPDWTTRSPFGLLEDILLNHDRVEVPVFIWPQWPKRVLRISAHIYNVPADYHRLAEALPKRLAEQR